VVSRFAKLAVSTVASTLVLIGLGGLVRATGSGLGCKTWPGCNTATDAVPPGEMHAWIEHTHRLWALVVIGLISWLAVEARRTGQPAGVRRVTGALVPIVLSQAVLGAFVVWLKLHAISVSAHLTVALVILGLATWVALDAVRRDGRLPAAAPVDGVARLARVARATAAVVFGQMILGSLVTGLDVGLAYSTFPSFNRRVVPVIHAEYWFKEGVHVAHRLVAFALVVMVVAVLLRARRPGVDPVVRRTAELATALVVVQVGLGALNIWWRLSAWSVVPHMVVGASLWTALVVVAVRSRWQADGVPTPPAASGPDRIAVGAR
jgi:cytochrome c oxidase assembly protein subunit 15